MKAASLIKNASKELRILVGFGQPHYEVTARDFRAFPNAVLDASLHEVVTKLRKSARSPYEVDKAIQEMVSRVDAIVVPKGNTPMHPAFARGDITKIPSEMTPDFMDSCVATSLPRHALETGTPIYYQNGNTAHLSRLMGGWVQGVHGPDYQPQDMIIEKDSPLHRLCQEKQIGIAGKKGAIIIQKVEGATPLLSETFSREGKVQILAASENGRSLLASFNPDGFALALINANIRNSAEGEQLNELLLNELAVAAAKGKGAAVGRKDMDTLLLLLTEMKELPKPRVLTGISHVSQHRAQTGNIIG